MNRIYRIFGAVWFISFLIVHSAAAQTDRQPGEASLLAGTTPGQAAGPGGTAAVSSSGSHSLALRNDGTVQAWGANDFGELGDGSALLYRTVPGPVPGLEDVTAVAAGTTHNLALKSDGTVWAWGRDTYGQLGDGSGWSWEKNYNGPHSDRNFVDQIHPVPGQVQNLDSVIAVAASDALSLALRSDGTVWAWGDAQPFGLGITAVPAPLPGLDQVVDIAAGSGYMLALKNDGTVWAAGYNTLGELGVGTAVDHPAPVRVTGLDSVVSIAAGGLHNLALKRDGTVWAWGSNAWGALGDGSTVARYVPVQVSGLGSVVSIAAGSDHSLAVTSDGSAWSWGINIFGQLGDGGTAIRTVPVRIQGIGSIRAAAGGESHSLAVGPDGRVWAWGANGLGQLGDGTTTTRLTPVPVAELPAPSVDRTPPVTAAVLDPASPSGRNGWYTQDVTVTLFAKDDASGVSATVYRINGGNWGPYTGPVTVNRDGAYTFEYRSTDHAGNAEAPRQIGFLVDQTAPDLSVQPARTVFRPQSQMQFPKMTIKTSDAGSGVDSVVLTAITCSMPNDVHGGKRADKGPGPMTERPGSRNGRVCAITYTATDKAGNRTNATVAVPVQPAD
ncbi:RCC1 domain-containing protein [Paenibacillus humicola]|uniref:RCC1 domain-containing protein n=1 Tax=Paenibacillus humicola TaxID=3110540 RepID=UPI00237A097F|nr:RCC1 domain-containing protein [Paenibacillus humicola]